MNSGLIRNQHLAMKLAIFVIAIAGAFEATWRQLAIQFLIFLIFMLLEHQTYAKLLFALRRALFFLTAYWVFVTLFAADFLAALLFSARIIYLVLVMVAVWGAINKPLMLRQCRPCTRFEAGRKLVSYLLSTVYFMQAYFQAYKDMPRSEKLQDILQNALDAGTRVHAQSAEIAAKVENELSSALVIEPSTIKANLVAAIFLFVLVMVGSL